MKWILLYKRQYLVRIVTERCLSSRAKSMKLAKNNTMCFFLTACQYNTSATFIQGLKEMLYVKVTCLIKKRESNVSSNECLLKLLFPATHQLII
jgi:hypothetical protein